MSIASPAPQRIVLTGSTGVLGSHILNELRKRPGTQVTAIHRKKADDLRDDDTVRHELIDFSRGSGLLSLFQRVQPTCVIHCAAEGLIFPQLEWFRMVHFNVDFTLQLFELASASPGTHFIHVSTGLAYRSTGQPLRETDAMDNDHPYGASKAAADILLRSAAIEFRTHLTILRPFSFTGPGDSRTRLFPSLLRAAMEKQSLALSPGQQVRDFCSARDIARAIVPAMDARPPLSRPAIYNLGSGRAVELRELIIEIVNELKIPVKLDFGARTYGTFEPMHLVADIATARRELGWEPRHRVAHAVWQLSRESFAGLDLSEPREFL